MIENMQKNILYWGFKKGVLEVVVITSVEMVSTKNGKAYFEVCYSANGKERSLTINGWAKISHKPHFKHLCYDDEEMAREAYDVHLSEELHSFEKMIEQKRRLNNDRIVELENMNEIEGDV